MKKEYNDKSIIVVAFGCQFMDKPIDGSLIRKCSDCGIEVWIAPSWKGKKIDKILCMNCYNKDVENAPYKGEKSEIVTCITEEQLIEFNNYYKKEHGYTMTKDEILIMLEKELGRKVTYKCDEKDD